MWTRGVLALICLPLVFASSAHAATITAGDARSAVAYSHIAATIPVPVPDAAITIKHDISVCDGGASCEWWTQREPNPRQYFIAIPADILVAYRREFFTHELGHVFDETDMTNADRSAFKRIMHFRGPWSTGVDSPPNEMFADAYSFCATHPVLKRDPDRSYGSYGYLPTRAQHRKVCALIKAAALT